MTLTTTNKYSIYIVTNGNVLRAVELKTEPTGQ